MLIEPEHYKGISFVRISTLPTEQRTRLKESFKRELIVKILRDNTLINDCIVYNDYVNWYRTNRKVSVPVETIHTNSIEVLAGSHQ